MSFRVNEISLDRAREQSCAEQLLVNTAFGFAFSFAGSVLLFTFRAPSARAKVQPLFSALAMEVVVSQVGSSRLSRAYTAPSCCSQPVLTASSALFTITQCTLDSIRETRDIKNTAVASAAVGALVGGLKYRSIVGAAVGAGVVALVGTGPEM